MTTPQEISKKMFSINQRVIFTYPSSIDDIIIVCKSIDGNNAIDTITKKSNCKISGIHFIDKNYLDVSIKIFDYTDIIDNPQLRIVCFSSELTHISMDSIIKKMNSYGISNFIFFMDMKNIKNKHRYEQNYFSKYKEHIAVVYDFLDDEESKFLYLSYLKARLLCDIGYLQCSNSIPYFHKKCTINYGDIMIDAGVSGSIRTLKLFSEYVGDKGKVYALEPEPNGYNEAKSKLCNENIKNIDLLNIGTWHKKEKLFINNKSGCSKVTNSINSDVSECNLIDIDTFCKDKNIQKVDVIKLDVEGCEYESILGARNTIIKFKPKLIVCLYHKNNDLIKLPMLIKSLNNNYKMYISHDSWRFAEFVLYCI